jgi:YbbR domain-containing protein
VAISNNDFVQIKFSAKSINLSSIKESNFSANVDLSGLGEGTYQKDIQVSSQLQNIQIVSVNPSKTTVRIEKKTSKMVPIRVRVDGSAKEGFIASDVTSTPSETEVNGPESIISAISEAVAPIKLDGESESFTRSADLFAYTAAGDQIKNLIFNPSTVQLKITVSAASEPRSVGIRVRLSGKIAAGFAVGSISTDPQIVTVSGSESLLASTKYLETQNVDITGLSQDKTFTIKLDVPNGLTVEDKLQSVKVTLQIISSTAIRQLSITPSITGLSQNQKATLDPPSLDVFVTGNPDLLNALGNDSVLLSIDLEKNAVTQDVTLNASQLNLPAGISFVRFGQNTVHITIQ